MSGSSLTRKANLGQVWTPSDIAIDMARQSLKLCGSPNKVLDPACGPGTFSLALSEAGASRLNLYSYDVDKRMIDITSKINRKLGFKGEALVKDYLTDTTLAGRFDLVIMNPPYIRQEEMLAGVPRRANMFALFLLKGLVDLAPGGILCAIVYDAISHTNYGQKVLRLMERHAEPLSQKHVRTPFDGVIVDAQVVLYRKRSKPLGTDIHESVIHSSGLVSLGELVDVRRGTGFPIRKVFIANREDPYFCASEPFFVKQGQLPGLIVKPDLQVYLEKAHKNPMLIAWLEGRAKTLGYGGAKLTVKGVSGRILFNYYIRNAPRHLWNPTNVAVSDNFYASVPKGDFPEEVAWLLLNSKPYLTKLIAAARNQGNGLLKLQLYEYKCVGVPDWRALPKRKLSSLMKNAKALIQSGATYENVRMIADKEVKGLFNE
jgi:adenine-specific DNA-methyltransferase